MLCLACCLAAVLLFAFAPLAAGEVTVALPVEVELMGDPPPAAADFTFRLEARQGAPLPDPATLTLRGAGSGTFAPIAYDAPGTYRYTLYQQTGQAAGYRWDDTVYEVTVLVLRDEKGGLTATVLLARQGAEGKAEGAVFTNGYTAPASPPEATPLPAVTPPPNATATPSAQTPVPNWEWLTARIPQTGDKAHPALWALGALGGLAGLACLHRVRKKQK